MWFRIPVVGVGEEGRRDILEVSLGKEMNFIKSAA